MRWILLLGLLAFTSGPREARGNDFLREERHAWMPYAWPYETSTNELARLLKYDFTMVGISFVGPYNGGNIDFSTLDRAIAMVAASGKKATLHLAPRFTPEDNIVDRLDHGGFLTNTFNRSPNYAIIDPFDPVQRKKFNHWLLLCAQRYRSDARVAGFVVGWGYMGETGFYIGDFLSDFNLFGTECAGYSDHALREFTAWRGKKGYAELKALPRPSPALGTAADAAPGRRDYVLFHQFRSEFLGSVFQSGAVGTLRRHVKGKPVGTFGYVAANVASYARDWTHTFNSSFYRTAGAAASFHLPSTLVDSGMGWEDNDLHDGHWNFTWARIRADMVRQIARGGVHHAMFIRDYETDPKWETNLFQNIASFVLTQSFSRTWIFEWPTIALYQPTWGAAALPSRNSTNLFTPREDHRRHLAKMIGLVESFGLPYKIVTEKELRMPRSFRRQEHCIVPMADQLPMVLGDLHAKRLLADPRVIPIPLGDRPLTRSEFRKILLQRKIPLRLDYQREQILAGRFGQVVYNFGSRPLSVEAEGKTIDLGPNAVHFLPAK